MIKRSVIILILLSSTVAVQAQNKGNAGVPAADCQGRLREAELAYQAGLFMKSAEILERSIDSCDLSRKEKEQALELLAKSYIEAGETGKAESIVDVLMRKYPHYELREERNPEMFNRMVKRYEIHPMLVIAAKNTGDWLRHKVTKVYSVLNTIDYSNPLNESGYFFTYYACGEYEFIKGLSISIDGMFFYATTFRSFEAEPTFFLSTWETDRFIEFPIYLKKYFDLGRNFRFYVSAGYGPLYNYYARAHLALVYTRADIQTTGKDQDFDNSIDNLDVLPINNKLTGQWNAGAGIGYSYRNLRFYADVRYLGEVGSYKAPEKSFLIPELKEDYFFIDQEMKINQFEVGVTISYTLFNSVKRRKPR